MRQGQLSQCRVIEAPELNPNRSRGHGEHGFCLRAYSFVSLCALVRCLFLFRSRK